jgi:hypothetical protein
VTRYTVSTFSTWATVAVFIGIPLATCVFACGVLVWLYG